MDVRLARPTDAPIVLTLALDEQAHLVKHPEWPAGRPALRSIIRSALPFTSRGRLWIARAGSSAAMLRAKPRRYVIGWDVTRLAVRGDGDQVLPAVVEAATKHLQSRGVPRLFARCREDAGEAMQRLGFRPLGREYILTGASRGVREAGELPLYSRYRMPQDAWPLHQLETDVTPPLVRQLEGLTSMDWAQGARGVSEIVVERDDRVVAWIGWGPARGSGTVQVGLLVHPQHRDLAPVLLEHVFDQTPSGTRLTSRVRSYQTEILQAFTDAGFTVAAEEIFMVRHARVELAETRVKRVQVARVPGIHAFPITITDYREEHRS